MRGPFLLVALFCLRAGAQQIEPFERTVVGYTDEARVAGLEGVVLLSGTLAADGTPGDFRVEQSLGLGLDEKALEAVRQWRFPIVPLYTIPNVAVDFLLPEKHSRWHLTRISFDPPEGATRPTFLSVKYPLGSGIALELGETAIEEARILAAVGRQAWAVVSFEVDENGLPGRFEVPEVSLDIWKNQAIALVREWRFAPGMKDGKPIVVRGTMNLVWGERDLPAAKLAQARPAEDPRPPKPATTAPGPRTLFPSPEPGVPRIAVPTDEQAKRLIERAPAPVQQSSPGAMAVRVGVLVGGDGHVRDAVPLDGPEQLMSAAAKIVKKWIYQPALLNGQPAEVTTVVVVIVPFQ
jgi:TonB family protein